MKYTTYAQYENESFDPNIESANNTLNALEAKAGKTPSHFISNIEQVNRMIFDLENAAPDTTSKTAAPSVVGGANLIALRNRYHQLINCLGLSVAYQAECKTEAEYNAAISRLETRLQASTGTTTSEPPTPAKGYTPKQAAVDFSTSPKASGLAKAIGAATRKADAAAA